MLLKHTRVRWASSSHLPKTSLLPYSGNFCPIMKRHSNGGKARYKHYAGKDYSLRSIGKCLTSIPEDDVDTAPWKDMIRPMQPGHKFITLQPIPRTWAEQYTRPEIPKTTPAFLLQKQDAWWTSPIHHQSLDEVNASVDDALATLKESATGAMHHWDGREAVGIGEKRKLQDLHQAMSSSSISSSGPRATRIDAAPVMPRRKKSWPYPSSADSPWQWDHAEQRHAATGHQFVIPHCNWGKDWSAGGISPPHPLWGECRDHGRDVYHGPHFPRNDTHCSAPIGSSLATKTITVVPPTVLRRSADMGCSSLVVGSELSGLAAIRSGGT